MDTYTQKTKHHQRNISGMIPNLFGLQTASTKEHEGTSLHIKAYQYMRDHGKSRMGEDEDDG